MNKNKLNQLSKKVKAISTKGLAKNLKNKFSILNGAKNFSSGVFQNYLVFMSAKKYFQYFIGTTRTDSWRSNTTKSGSNFAPTFLDHHVLPGINFDEHGLIIIYNLFHIYNYL